MESIFPFGLPGPTAFYLSLHQLTFILHQAFMHYVLAGSLYVLWTALAPGDGDQPRWDQPLANTIRDWMPFVLSAAITAGVAPLLFVQILYQQQFYTASLLLAWRSLMIVPVLIVAFYLLYLIKSTLMSRWPAWVRVGVVSATCVCFVLVGFGWTATHLLANDQAGWTAAYTLGSWTPPMAVVAFRMLVWIGGSFPTLAVIAGWQLSGQSPEKDTLRTETSRLAYMALGGLTVATVAMVVCVLQCDEATRGYVWGRFARAYLLLAMVGAAAQAVGWLRLMRRGALSRLVLSVITAGVVLALLGVAIVRETIRLSGIDIALLAKRHAEVAQIGGFGVFLVLSAVNFGLIAGCIWLIRRQLASRAGA